MKKQRGITLIALIITIIIMLILSGVVINLTIGKNGIFKMAKKAGEDYEIASIKEQIATDVFSKQVENKGNISDDTLETILRKYGALSEEENLMDKTLTTDKGNYEIKVSDIFNGITVKDEQQKPEEPGEKPGEGPETPKIDEKVLALKAGDYIKYNSGENGEILCRVLYPVSSEYGLQIISDKSVKNVTLGSETYSESVKAYNNAIETLNNEAEAYINTEFAYDARCVGSLPTVENGMFTKKDNGATTYVTPKFATSNYIKNLDEDTNYETDKAQMETEDVNLWNIGEEYWLASRGIEGDIEVNRLIYFFIRSVDNRGDLNGYYMNVMNSSVVGGFVSDNGLRPCISLKSNVIKITSGDGKSTDTAYVIGK